ncbi:TauD/TfdA-like domain [Trinorchestia longiramus]|nr:TauD/TfdA-like domain [Trinorchestia longiramus]
MSNFINILTSLESNLIHRSFKSYFGNSCYAALSTIKESSRACSSSAPTSPRKKTTPTSATVIDYGSRIEVRGKNWPNSLHIPHTWLRDHCRCPQCYDSVTLQRKFDVADMPLTIRPARVAIEGDSLVLKWPDGHQTEFSLQFLWQHTHAGHISNAKDTTTAWGARTFPALFRISVQESSLCDSSMTRLLALIEQYGVAMVTQVTPDLASTKKVAEAVAPCLRTFFGEYWNSQPDHDKADSAYTTEALGAHTDSTYFSQAARVQVFHVLEAAKIGGDTLLVDGLKVAQIMQEKHPEAYEFFSEQHVPGEYIGDGHHHHSVHKIFTHHPVTGAFQQIRYNLYDRAPINTLSVSAVERYYQHIKCLAGVVNSEQVQVWLRLVPGGCSCVSGSDLCLAQTCAWWVQLCVWLRLVPGGYSCVSGSDLCLVGTAVCLAQTCAWWVQLCVWLRLMQLQVDAMDSDAQLIL